MEVVACSQLSQRYGTRWVLTRLDFELAQGTCLLLTGANGSGKTTLLRVLATAMRPSRGTLRLFGRAVWPNGLVARRGLALMTHQHYFYEGLSATQNLQYIAALAGSRVVETPAGLLERVGLAHTGQAPVSTFSAGMKRRLALARLVALRPRLVLLDEPLAQLDPAGQSLVRTLIDEMVGHGATLVVSSHDIEGIQKLCTHALHLQVDGVAPSVQPLKGPLSTPGASALPPQSPALSLPQSSALPPPQRRA